MIRDAIEYGLWKNVKLLEPLPNSADIYEASRIAICPELDMVDPARKLILDRLVYGQLALAHQLGVERMIGIMYRGIWRTVYEKRGVPIRFLSEPFSVDGGHPILIGEIIMTPDVVQGLRQRLANQIACGEIAPAVLDDETLLAHQSNVRNAVLLPPF